MEMDKWRHIENFLEWLYTDNHLIIKMIDDHDCKEYSKEDILNEYKMFLDKQSLEFKEEMRKEGKIVCSCNCIFPIEKERIRDNKIQCPYCGGRHKVIE